MIGWSLILIAVWFCISVSGTAFANQGKDPESTHPDAYTTVEEVERHGERTRIQSTVSEIDDRSLISIAFDETKMRKPENGKTQVKIRVEAFQTKGGDRDRIAPIDNYVARRTDDGRDDEVSNFLYRDRPYNPAKRDRVPNTIIDPSRLAEKDVDQIEIRIINLKTKERVVFFLRLREFGFRTKLTDTFMFFKRIGVNQERQEQGIDTVNFSPAAGVTYGTTWLPRNDNWFKKLIRPLRPGTGLNASILKWNDLDYDPKTGAVSNPMRRSSLNVGLGVQVSLFNNILMFSYGVNLQAEQNRRYYGIGISIIQLNGAISEGSP